MAPLLPLFPLDVVLLPGTPLPLHIFEPRYKEMIGECRAQHSAFGVVRAVEKGIAHIGCTAEILSVTKEYADGRLDIVTEGRKRFEVVELDHERSFLRGIVRMIEDESDLPSSQEVAPAMKLHAEVLDLAGATQDVSGADRAQLSFYLAGSLPLDLDFKQQFLMLRSESERMSTLASYLETILPNLRRAVRASKKTGGNGHVH